MAGNANQSFAVVRLLGDQYLKILSITPMANGHFFLNGLGIPGATNTLQSVASINGAFVPLASVSADANAAWHYEDAPPPGLASRFYRLSFP
jgi:hypothetical protein